jgi:ABC-2 type transport system ATP-binding protein
MHLSIQDVDKRYRGGTLALSGICLDVGRGVLGLLGPNGAGKSTLMRIVATITRPSRGRVLWNGIDVAAEPDTLRSVLGYLPQDFGVYPHLTAVELLRYLAAVKGLSPRIVGRRIDELLRVVHLEEARDLPLGGFSGGMRQRVGIAQALLNDPQLLIVDEPTVGLDPEERARFRHLLTELAGERIVLLSTHIVSDLEAAATDVAVIDGGRLLERAAPEDLLARAEGRVWQWVVPSAELAAVRAGHQVSAAVRRADGVHLRVVAEAPPSPDARPALPTLEDAYLWIVGRRPESDDR